jgi:hypothetical protein
MSIWLTRPKNKTCPLCKKLLATKYPIHPDTTIRLICSTHIHPTSKLSHYYIEITGQYLVEVIHAFPYTIINSSKPDKEDRSDIYPLNAESFSGITKQKMIVSLPRFVVGDPAKLQERIKIYILFS